MEIRIDRIHKLSSNQSLKAFADITVNDALLIKGVRVLNGKNGLFVTMPQDQGKDNKWYDVVRCLNQEVRQQITDEVLTAYQE